MIVKFLCVLTVEIHIYNFFFTQNKLNGNVQTVNFYCAISSKTQKIKWE